MSALRSAGTQAASGAAVCAFLEFVTEFRPRLAVASAFVNNQSTQKLWFANGGSSGSKAISNNDSA